MTSLNLARPCCVRSTPCPCLSHEHTGFYSHAFVSLVPSNAGQSDCLKIACNWFRKPKLTDSEEAAGQEAMRCVCFQRKLAGGEIAFRASGNGNLSKTNIFPLQDGKQLMELLVCRTSVRFTWDKQDALHISMFKRNYSGMPMAQFSGFS